MKKIAHRVEVSVFIPAEEEERKEHILQSLRSFFPFDLEQEKIGIETEKAQGFQEREILIASVVVKRNKHVNAVLESIRERLSEVQRKVLLDQAETRMDKRNNFYLRFDKEALCEREEVYLTDKGNCFHIRITLAAFPKTRENALEALRAWLAPGQTI